MRKDLFTITSRYYTVDTAQLVTADGKTIVYLRRRRVPQPEEFVTLREHSVVDGDRLDNITAQFVGDPEQFWRLCDLNRVQRPVDLTATPGTAVGVPSLEGGG